MRRIKDIYFLGGVVFFALLLSQNPIICANDEIPIPPDSLRSEILHNSGNWYLPLRCGITPAGLVFRDPETGANEDYGLFPVSDSSVSIFSLGLWVGGIVGEDTLVSTGGNPNSYSSLGGRDFWPENPEKGGFIRLGNVADDEFVGIYTDTITDPDYVGAPSLYDSAFVPLGIQIRQHSYSWADSNYDDIIIIEFSIKNIRTDTIEGMWIGLYMDADMLSNPNAQQNYDGYRDDDTGLLDTLLYDDDSNSHLLIPYCYDNDGDPDVYNQSWGQYPVRQAVSLSVLQSSLPNPRFNYNWWFPAYPGYCGYGPRRLGTPDNPFREFAGGCLGAPQKREDLYYVLSHPERDYNQIESAIIDSSDGWVPHNDPLSIVYYDTRFLLSFGACELAPGDSVSFAIALVGTEAFHENPSDFATYFNPEHPFLFEEHLDFEKLLNGHRRADSIYKSGFTLPQPAPPVGLRVAARDDSFVNLVWNKKQNSEVAGYYLLYKDTVFNQEWQQVQYYHADDTEAVFPILYPTHEHFFAVQTIDVAGRVSLPSFWTSTTPGRPHTPDSFAVSVDEYFPELSWVPIVDTSLQVYYIYRSCDGGAYALYDSTSSLSYRDVNVESGIWYGYYLTAVNDYGLESFPTEKQSVLPMAFDRKILFYDMNADYAVHSDAYRKEYVDELLSSVESNIRVDYSDIEYEDMSLLLLSHYEIVIFDAEKNAGKFTPSQSAVIGSYLLHGGKALFITPNVSDILVEINRLHISRYQPGDFFYDVLRIDSAVTNALVFSSGMVYGDLIGCQSVRPGFPSLQADTNKLAVAPLPIVGGLPMSGCIYPRNGVDTLYKYSSLYPDSVFYGRVNGYLYRNETYSFVLYNFPLSLMSLPENNMAFRRALTELGVTLTCGDINDDNRVNVADAVVFINYLYKGGDPPPDTWRADTNCDGEMSLGDVLEIINRIFRGGAYPQCCPVEK